LLHNNLLKCKFALMKHLFLFLILLPILSFSNSEIDLIYFSPQNNSYFHNPSTSIIIRNRFSLDVNDLNKNLHVILEGTYSEEHQYVLRLADDNRTIIIDPVIDFTRGEKVGVKIYYKEIFILEYYFNISNKDNSYFKNADPEYKPLVPVIPDFSITVNNDSYNGNIFFMTGGAMYRPVSIVDTSGDVLFSKHWPMQGFEWKVNHNNHLTYFDRSTKHWLIRDSLYNVVDSVGCANGYLADNHDFMALDNGHKVLIAYDDQPFDMSLIVVGGDPNAIVEGFIVQELDANNNLVFQWRSWDHFSVTDNVYLDLTISDINFIHGNAVDIDFDGDFLISSRSLDEITKIDRITGDLIWRWGGSQNQFTFVNDYPFTHQHSIRSVGVNRYLLYDNGNHSDQHIGVNLSRAVEYELDTVLMTAEKLWDFSHPDSLYAPSTGCVQRLPNGNTFINWGNLAGSGLGAIFTELDTIQQIVFQMEFTTGQNVYRAHKFNWFFDDSIVGCMDTSAINFDSNAIISDTTDCLYSPLFIDHYNKPKKIIKIIDVLGREVKEVTGKLIFYIYNDGTVEKKIIIK